MGSFGAIDHGKHRSASANSSPTVNTTPVTPVAVIGMGCRLPGGINSPEQLWEALLRGDDLVLLYTDGLVERRHAPPGERLGQVKRTLIAVSANQDDQTLLRLRGLLHHPSPDDDTCVLAVRVLA